MPLSKPMVFRMWLSYDSLNWGKHIYIVRHLIHYSGTASKCICLFWHYVEKNKVCIQIHKDIFFSNYFIGKTFNNRVQRNLQFANEIEIYFDWTKGSKWHYNVFLELLIWMASVALYVTSSWKEIRCTLRIFAASPSCRSATDNCLVFCLGVSFKRLSFILNFKQCATTRLAFVQSKLYYCWSKYFVDSSHSTLVSSIFLS